MLISEFMIKHKMMSFTEYANHKDRLIKEKEITKISKTIKNLRKIKDYPITIHFTWCVNKEDVDNNIDLIDISFSKMFILEAMKRNGYINETHVNDILQIEDSYINTDSVGVIVKVYAETELDRDVEYILNKIGKGIEDIRSYNDKPEVDEDDRLSNRTMLALRISLFEKYLDSIELWTRKSNRVKVMYDYARKYINEALGVSEVTYMDIDKHLENMKGVKNTNE